MKCVRCGKLVEDTAKQCLNCGYDIHQHKKVEEYYEKFKERQDPEVDPRNKSQLVDNPILTFIFGMASMMLPMLSLADFGLFRWLILLLSYGLSYLTFVMASKPTKVKLESVRNFGKILGYLGFSLTVFLTVFHIWGLF